jgi:hypothetical protein
MQLPMFFLVPVFFGGDHGFQLRPATEGMLLGDIHQRRTANHNKDNK